VPRGLHLQFESASSLGGGSRKSRSGALGGMGGAARGLRSVEAGGFVTMGRPRDRRVTGSQAHPGLPAPPVEPLPCKPAPPGFKVQARQRTLSKPVEA
jgi:hypothetical protein